MCLNITDLSLIGSIRLNFGSSNNDLMLQINQQFSFLEEQEVLDIVLERVKEAIKQELSGGVLESAVIGSREI